MNEQHEVKKALLKGVGERLAILDEHLIHLIKRRIELSTLVIDIKGSDPIVVLEREKERIERIGAIAEEIGIERHLAQGLLHSIINAGVKHQTIIRDSIQTSPDMVNPGDRTPESLRRNLLLLTAQVASSYDGHQDSCPATLFTYKREDELIRECKKSLNHKGTLLDLGTATGRMVFSHRSGFRSVKGFDISPEMIKVAREKNSALEDLSRIHFDVCDLEEGIPVEDGSVSMIIINNGTCGDIRNIENLISEINRVLIRGGVAYLSFYNSESLVHKSILSWQSAVSAIFNPVLHTLEVELKGVRGTIPIYAKPFSTSEVRSMVERHLTLTKITTFPCITSLLPRELLRDGIVEPLLELDRHLCDTSNEFGSYIVAVARKS